MNLLDNPVVQGISKLADFLILNLLWILCSIPIITIGASTTALYTVTLKLVKNEEGYIAKGFLKAFKENFRQSTAIWLIFVLAGIVLAVDFSALSLMPDSITAFCRVLFTVMACLMITASIYAFGLQARFVNTVKNTLKNAVILVFAKLPLTLLLLVITAVPIIATFLTPQTLMIGSLIWFFIGVSVLACLQSLCLRHVFAQLEKPEEPDDEPGAVEE